LHREYAGDSDLQWERLATGHVYSSLGDSPVVTSQSEYGRQSF